MSEFRKPVAGIVDPKGSSTEVGVICDDGSVWLSNSDSDEVFWKEITPIPGTRREKELEQNDD